VTVWGINGKGESADWEAMVPACADFHNAVDEDLPEAALRILEAALRHAQAASARSRASGRAKPSGVLLIEEWAAIRAQTKTVLGKAGLEKLDGLMGRILATARSGGVHCVLITQRPQGDSFPIDQRDNVVQRVVLRMTRDETVRIALGHEPKHAAPTRAGEALLLDDEQGERFVLVDNVPEKAWEGICARAVALRASEAAPAAPAAQNAPESAETLRGSDPAPPAPGLPRDPTLSGVVYVLGDGDPAGMSSETIMYTLPEHLRVHPRPPDIAATGDEAVAARRNAANAMGKALGKWSRADDPLIRSKKTPGPRLWQLTAPAMAPGGSRQDVPAPATAPAIAASDVPRTCHPPATDPDNGASDPPLAANGGKIGPQTPEIGPQGLTCHCRHCRLPREAREARHRPA
jgi:hypothetical protein